MTIARALVVAGCAASAGSTTLSGACEQVAIFTHCGFYEADFDGDLWTPDIIERGDYPEGTDSIATEGVMTRDGDRALFESDSGLEIWFKLAPPPRVA